MKAIPIWIKNSTWKLINFSLLKLFFVHRFIKVIMSMAVFMRHLSEVPIQLLLKWKSNLKSEFCQVFNSLRFSPRILKKTCELSILSYLFHRNVCKNAFFIDGHNKMHHFPYQVSAFFICFNHSRVAHLSIKYSSVWLQKSLIQWLINRFVTICKTRNR